MLRFAAAVATATAAAALSVQLCVRSFGMYSSLVISVWFNVCNRYTDFLFFSFCFRENVVLWMSLLTNTQGIYDKIFILFANAQSPVDAFTFTIDPHMFSLTNILHIIHKRKAKSKKKCIEHRFNCYRFRFYRTMSTSF